MELNAKNMVISLFSEGNTCETLLVTDKQPGAFKIVEGMMDTTLNKVMYGCFKISSL